jgi:TetR/AcrR family transcriptional regulator, transcriptional repressor for nem operon
LKLIDDQSIIDVMPNQIENLPRTHAARKQGAQTTRERLIHVGIQKVLESGWAATSIDVVLRECDVPKGSFYHYFASKEAFGYALLDDYQAFFMQRLSKWFVVQPIDSSQRMQAAMEGFLADAIAGMERYDYQRGCMVGALGQEVASFHAGFRAKLMASLLEWEKTLSNALFNSVSSYINNSKLGANITKTTGLLQFQCDDWSREFWVAWEGAVLRSLLARDSQALNDVVQRSMLQLRGWPGWMPITDSSDGALNSSILACKLKSKKSKKSNEINDVQVRLNF